MELNIKKLFLFEFLICALMQRITIVAGKQNYWPPTIDESLEKHIIKRLNSENAITINSTLLDNPQLIVMVTQTENGLSPKPSKFATIPYGFEIALNFDCSKCDPYKFSLNTTTYNAKNFHCKTLCIFTALKSKENKYCSRGENFDVGITVNDKFMKIMSACHNMESSTIEIMRNLIYKKLGMFSRKILSGDEKCRTKCMPVCMQPLEIGENITSMSSELDTDQFEENFVNSLLMLNEDSIIDNFHSYCSRATRASMKLINVITLVMAAVMMYF